jgi:hypothetical protein
LSRPFASAPRPVRRIRGACRLCSAASGPLPGRAFADAALAPVFEAEARAYAPADAGLAERLEAFAGRLERAFDRIGRAR